MSWWRRLFSRTRLESELDAELRDHVERMAADLEASGADPADARRRALASLGGLDPTKEYCRDARGTRWVEDTVQDVKYRDPRRCRAPRICRRGGAFAGARHWRQHGDLLAGEQPAAARDTSPRARSSRAHRSGSFTNPIWEQVAITMRASSRASPRTWVTSSISRQTGRPSWYRRCGPAARFSTSLACPRSSAARTPLKTIAAGGAERARRRDQLCVLAASFRRRGRRHRPFDHRQPRGAHDRRRDAAGVSRSGSRTVLDLSPSRSA